jgi:cyclase
MQTGKENPEEPKLIQLAHGLWVRQEIDNLLWADLGGAGLAVDALEHADKADDVFAAIEQTIDVGIDYLVHTHLHYDHVALDAAFARRYHSEMIDTQGRAAQQGPGRVIKGSRRTVSVIPMGGLHTSEDCVVWIEPDAVLCTGDLFGWGVLPLTRRLTDETCDQLVAALVRMIDMQPRVVVPGHGPLATAQTLERQVAYFNWLRDQTRQLVAAGASDDEIAGQLAIPADMTDWWRLAKWKHADSVAKFTRYARRDS